MSAGQLGLRIIRAVGEGVHEDLDVANYGLTLAHFNLEIALRSDFADLFEVKSRKFVRRGRIETAWDAAHAELRMTCMHKDFRRQLVYRLLDSDSTAHYANGRVTFEITLPPGSTWHSCCYYILAQGDSVRAPVYGCSDTHGQTELDKLQSQWRAHATSLTSTNEDLYRLYRQSVEDMGALRLYDHDFAPDVWLPAAGVPWFVTIFGRDSLIASLQNMIVFPRFACGVLTKLGEYQATAIDDWRDPQTLVSTAPATTEHEPLVQIQSSGN